MDEGMLLLRLARIGALERYITLTTREFGEELGMSQQAASLYLKTLENRNLIERTKTRSGSRMRITPKGLELLQGLYEELRSILGVRRSVDVIGIVYTGLGEGGYYLSQKGYREQIKEIFGVDPFPGTLNIRLSRPDLPLLDLLRRGPGILIKGFISGDRTFGPCLCYSCEIEGEKGVIMVPRRTLHNDTVEVVSDRKLREVLLLDDGDEVHMRVNYPEVAEDEKMVSEDHGP